MIKERILQIAKRKGITNREICQKIGLTYGGFTGENKKRPVNSDAIANLLAEYPDVDPRWLLTGQGSMLREQSAPEVAPPPSEPAFPGFIEEIKSLSVKVGRLEAENEHLRAAIEAKQKEIEEGTREIDNKEREIEAQQKEIEAQQKEIEAQQKEIEAKQREIERLQIENRLSHSDTMKKRGDEMAGSDSAHSVPPSITQTSSGLLNSQLQNTPSHL